MTDHPDEITVSVREENAAVVLKGHEKRECEECGHTVIVNPAALMEIKQGDYPDYILCMTCATKTDRQHHH